MSTVLYSPTFSSWHGMGVEGEVIPVDVVEVPEALFLHLRGWAIQMVDGLPARLEAPPVNPVPALIAAVQDKLDAAARALGYDDIKTAITYRGDPNAKFAAEAEAFFLWRSACWTTAYSILAQVQTGALDALPTVEELDALMPAIPGTTPSPA